MLTPFADTGFAGGESRHLKLGLRFDASRMDLGVELLDEHSESGAAGSEYGVKLDLMFRF